MPPEDLLRHMLDEAEYLVTRSARLSLDRFPQNQDQQRAFVHALEIVGAAARKLDRGFRDLHPVVEWRAIAGPRDKSIHDYEGVDSHPDWDMVKPDIPPFLDQVRALLAGSEVRHPPNGY